MGTQLWDVATLVVIPVTLWEGTRVFIGRRYRLNLLGWVLAAMVTSLLPVLILKSVLRLIGVDTWLILGVGGTIEVFLAILWTGLLTFWPRPLLRTHYAG